MTGSPFTEGLFRLTFVWCKDQEIMSKTDLGFFGLKWNFSNGIKIFWLHVGHNAGFMSKAEMWDKVKFSQINYGILMIFYSGFRCHMHYVRIKTWIWSYISLLWLKKNIAKALVENSQQEKQTSRYQARKKKTVSPYFLIQVHKKLL